MNRIACCAMVFSMMAGCANQQSIYRTFDVSKGESPMVDIRQRAILVSRDATTFKVCAEPSPDAMAASAYELAAKGGTADKFNAELALALNDSATFTGIRTQSIQLLRDFGYRLCESHMSGAINAAQYDLLMRRFQKNTVALLAIEQLTGTARVPPVALLSSGKAEATKSLAEQRAEREKIGDAIAGREKEQDEIKQKKAAALAKDANADTKDLDNEITALDGKIARLKDDQKAVDQAIAQTKGVLAEGKTDVVIKTEGQAGARSEQHLQSIALVVQDIVNNIVLADDEKQLCLATMQGSSLSAEQKKFVDLCLNNMASEASAKAARIDLYREQARSAGEQLASASSTTAQRQEAAKKLEEAKKELRQESLPTRIYSANPSLK